MSDYQRKHLPPAEFASLVSEYYQRKAPFNKTITNILENLEIMPEDNHDKTSAGKTDTSAGAKSATKATSQDHQANPGPVITENIEKPLSREELHKRAKELNGS